MDPSTFDFAGFYRERVRAANRPERSPDYWDGRAASMSERGFDTPYVREFLARMDLSGCSTLLDVGCGPGTIALSAAPRLARVYGLDHSPSMLAAFAENARARGVTTATPILRSWDDDWSDVPVCDVVVASRSTAVPDLEAAIVKLHAMARRRVYVTYPADGHLVADDVRGGDRPRGVRAARLPVRRRNPPPVGAPPHARLPPRREPPRRRPPTSSSFARGSTGCSAA